MNAGVSDRVPALDRYISVGGTGEMGWGREGDENRPSVL